MEPKPEDLVGTYTVVSYILPLEVSFKDLDGVVELRADGTFTAKNIPRLPAAWPEAQYVPWLVSGEGQWEVKPVRTGSRGSRETWGVQLRTPDNHLPSARLIAYRSPYYGLAFTFGDPDYGHLLLLDRQD